MDNAQAIILGKAYARKVDGAKQFARAQRSDPFAFSRAMSHIKTGLCEPYYDEKRHKWMECYYNAKPATVTRPLPDGVAFSNGSDTFEVLEYHDQVRP